jgi:hypothetical protein
MGCSVNTNNDELTKLDIIQYEEYSKSNPSTLEVILYNLDWKTRPDICVFQKIDEQIIEKEEATNIDELLEVLQFEEVKSFDFLIENGFIIYYLYIDSGVIITRNIDKINYFFGSKMDQIIKLCIIDISSIISSEPEYFCIHELKKQSIYFFDLTNKEINFSARNKLVNLGKDENLSDTEIDLTDEIIEEEKESYQFSQTVDPNLLIENKNDQKDEEMEGDEGNNLITDNNEKELDLQKENSKSIENNLNAIHSKVKNFLDASDKIEEMSEIYEKNEENELEEKAYEINGDSLIISGSEITPEINRELEKILFNTTIGDENPFDYVNFYSEQNNKKRKKRRRRTNRDNNYPDEEDFNDYILINKKNGIPYERKICLNTIKKIIFKNCSFSSDSTIYLKQFFIMLSRYKFLKLAIYKNNISPDFIGWKFLRQLLKENFNLRWVSFKNAGFNDKIFEEVISGMTLKRIRYLNISRNKITNKGMYILKNFLMKNQTLLILDMSNNNNVTCEGIRLIANALKMHPNITQVNLSNNNLAGAGNYLGGLARDNKNLKSLLIRNICLESIDIKFFAEEMCKKGCTINNLDIGLNAGIGDEGLKEIGKIIENNKSLISIGLDGLNFTMNNYLPVFQAIFKNKNIERYSLNMNPGLPLKGILNFFLKNPHVKELSIIPWNINKDKEKVFKKEQLIQLLRFHLKSPQVIIHGIKFIEYEN